MNDLTMTKDPTSRAVRRKIILTMVVSILTLSGAIAPAHALNGGNRQAAPGNSSDVLDSKGNPLISGNYYKVYDNSRKTDVCFQNDFFHMWTLGGICPGVDPYFKITAQGAKDGEKISINDRIKIESTTVNEFWGWEPVTDTYIMRSEDKSGTFTMDSDNLPGRSTIHLRDDTVGDSGNFIADNDAHGYDPEYKQYAVSFSFAPRES
ncbi:hypothetical protein [uncultured Kocuria sp.]|uniref:hypothetical protein n=1 Tax=uncultured Kocuria sp. TaxID=259305 RepID=UPI0025989D4C|nr:hypothetical protein [uncultured Kocuria sp.]